MNYAKVIVGLIATLAVVAQVISFKSPTLYYPFYKADTWGLCTVFTFVPYTTNILSAVDFNPIYQNSYYTTSVFDTCPYTYIYKAQIEMK